MSACSLVQLPVKRDERGALAFAQVGTQLPFAAARIFHLFDLRPGVARGGHSHRRCHQFLIAMAGNFAVTTHDGHEATTWRLENPSVGLHVPPGHWVDLVPSNAHSVLAVLASDGYDESDYIRDREIFLSQTKR
jgi:dTDP-4-dehydrorhamnose 3,5-epimerase-like enzyme